MQLPKRLVIHELMHGHRHLLRTRGSQYALSQLGVRAPHPFPGSNNRQPLRHGIDQLGIHVLLEHQRLNHGSTAQIAQLLSTSAVKINVIVGRGQLSQWRWRCHTDKVQLDVSQRALAPDPYLSQQPLETGQIAIVAEITGITHPLMRSAPSCRLSQYDLRPELTKRGVQLPE